MIVQTDSLTIPISDINPDAYKIIFKSKIGAFAVPNKTSKKSFICGALSILFINVPLIPLILSILAIIYCINYRNLHYGYDCRQSKLGGLLGKIYLCLWIPIQLTTYILNFLSYYNY